jgi:hypothetical protein
MLEFLSFWIFSHCWSLWLLEFLFSYMGIGWRYTYDIKIFRSFFTVFYYWFTWKRFVIFQVSCLVHLDVHWLDEQWLLCTHTVKFPLISGLSLKMIILWPNMSGHRTIGLEKFKIMKLPGNMDWIQIYLNMQLNCFIKAFTIPEYWYCLVWWHTTRQLAESYCDTSI